MKIYQYGAAPNPRRVRMFLAEKGIPMEYVEVSIEKQEHKTPTFLRKNPFAGLPVLELDDGSHLSETIAICRYFENRYPDPNLLGESADEQVWVEMWQRRMELGVFYPVAMVFRMTHEYFRGLIPQVPQWGEVNRVEALERFQWLDQHFSANRHVAGERYTVADITLLCAVDFGRITGVRITPEQEHFARWYAEVSSRASAKA